LTSRGAQIAAPGGPAAAKGARHVAGAQPIGAGKVGITRPIESVIVGPKIVSSIIWTASAIKPGQA
jgi:hypothetical protein